MDDSLEVDGLRFFEDLGRLGEQLQVLAAQKTSNVDQVIKAMEHKMMQFIDTYSLELRNIQDAATISAELLDYYHKLHRREIQFMQSGIPALDEILLGFMPDCVYLFAARAGTGKTALLMSLARRFLDMDKIVYAASAEMSSRALGQRLVSQYTGVSVASQMPGISSLDLERLNAGTDELATKKLFVNDTPCIAIEQIDSDMRWLLTQGIVPDVVLIDYVQLVRSRKSSGRTTEYEETTMVSKGTTLLAKKYHVPVLAAAQQNREVEKRASKDAKLGDLRGSGGLEQDAHFVGYIHNEKPDTPMDERVIKSTHSGIPIIYTCQLQVAKHRNGPTGWVNMKYHAPLMEFYAENEQDWEI